MKTKQDSMMELRKQIEEIEARQGLEAKILRDQFNQTCESLKEAESLKNGIKDVSNIPYTRIHAKRNLTSLSIALFARRLFGLLYQKARA
jgi:hypothetical protein